MYITRPNGDVLSGKKKKVLERMEAQQIRKIKETATSAKHEGIKPDEDMIAFMELATTNGRIDAVGYRGETRVVESTLPHPTIERTFYNQQKQSILSAMIEYSSRMVDKLIARG